MSANPRLQNLIKDMFSETKSMNERCSANNSNLSVRVAGVNEYHSVHTPCCTISNVYSLS